MQLRWVVWGSGCGEKFGAARVQASQATYWTVTQPLRLLSWATVGAAFNAESLHSMWEVY